MFGVVRLNGKIKRLLICNIEGIMPVAVQFLSVCQAVQLIPQTLDSETLLGNSVRPAVLVNSASRQRIYPHDN